MFDTFYIEEDVKTHPTVQRYLEKAKNPHVIFCKNYKEIFNRRKQSFREQKKHTAMILAKKRPPYLHPIPEAFSIGGKDNFYFSHILNCPFDCQYCFLQGMYQSAYFVHFVNYEETLLAIKEKGSGHFFSGYDGDSLALEPKTRFLETFLPFFRKNPKALLEIRTKSAYTKPFFQHEPMDNCVIAWSLNPENIVRNLEKKTASLEKRLQALKAVQDRGWKIGLRFDPIIEHAGFFKNMQVFFEEVFSYVQQPFLHSVTLGAFRLPKTYKKTMEKNVSSLNILAHSVEKDRELRYEREKELLAFCEKELEKYVPQQKLFKI